MPIICGLLIDLSRGILYKWNTADFLRSWKVLSSSKIRDVMRLVISSKETDQTWCESFIFAPKGMWTRVQFDVHWTVDQHFQVSGLLTEKGLITFQFPPPRSYVFKWWIRNWCWWKVAQCDETFSMKILGFSNEFIFAERERKKG